MRLNNLDVSEQLVGYIHAGYYMGLLVAALKIEPLIQRIGHIRAFSAFASLTTLTILIQALFPSLWVWFIARFLAGICIAALYVTIESWLLSESTSQTRGKILAIYMVTLYASQAASQYILQIIKISTYDAFLVAGALCSLSVIPVAITYKTTPQLHDVPNLKVFKYLKEFPYGFLGCAISGLMLSAFYSFTPNFAQDKAISVPHIMSFTIAGGFILQWPLGKLSDILDRKVVLFWVSVATLVPSILICFLADYEWAVLVLSFLLGGLSFALYPLSIAEVCDHVEQQYIVAATGVLLFAYGLGSVVGPLIVSWFIVTFNSTAMYAYLALVDAILVLMGLYTLFSKTQNRVEQSIVPDEESVDFVSLPRMTPVANELNPQSPPQEDEDEVAEEMALVSEDMVTADNEEADALET